MKSSLVSSVVSLLLGSRTVQANLALALNRPVPPIISIEAATLVNYTGAGVFDQPIDHTNISLGTFPQRYWYNYTNWGGPGYPIVLFTPGEVAGDRYGSFLTERTMGGVYGKATKAALILIEHRYWGASTPFKVLDTKALRYHTLENAVADMVNFARNVKLPFDQNGSSNAPRAPWIFTGGSYAGALAAWVAKLSPGTYWGYVSSSAPVQAINNFWQYFEPIREGMPKNCSTNFVNIIDKVDATIFSGNRTAIDALKVKFGLAELSHDDDFASALSVPIGEWQSTSFTTGHDTFFQMCDAIQGVPTNLNAAGIRKPALPARPASYEETVPVDVAMDNFAKWYKDEYISTFCHDNFRYDEYKPKGSIGCLESYNTSMVMYTDLSSNNTFNRPWFWMLCNEPFYYWQTGAPPGEPSMVSRLVTPEYFQRQCGLFFPTQDGYTFAGAHKRDNGGKRTTDDLNGKTGGWLLSDTRRLAWVNGEYDPWSAASVSSKYRPGGRLASSKDVPVFLVKNGSHCTDISVAAGNANAGLKKIQEEMTGLVKGWVDEFWALNGAPKARDTVAREFEA